MTLSILICSIDHAKFNRVSQMYGRLLTGVEFEILWIPDAKGLCEGYNRGLAQSRGELVIFSHDDVEFLATDFCQKLLGHMRQCDVLGIAGTRRQCDSKWNTAALPDCYGQVATPDPRTGRFDIYAWSVPTRLVAHIQAMDGVFLCARRQVAQAVGWDQQTFDGWHLYDLDFTFRAHLAGHRLAVATDLYLIHDSPGHASPEWLEYARRFHRKCGTMFARRPDRIARFALISVPTQQDIIDTMTPRHWMD